MTGYGFSPTPHHYWGKKKTKFDPFGHLVHDTDKNAITGSPVSTCWRDK